MNPTQRDRLLIAIADALLHILSKDPTSGLMLRYRLAFAIEQHRT